MPLLSLAPVASEQQVKPADQKQPTKDAESAKTEAEQVAADGSKPLDLPDFSKVNQPPPTDNPRYKAQVGCRRRDGTLVKKGDSGFDSCMMDASLKHDDIRVGTDPVKTGFGSPNVNLHFGGK
ncbi:MAG TPA: hypothetical protein VM432_00675 [Bdellovibrionales bacterium]|nr:hypothetical protein [Bdellovibrionales bacterium]